MTHRLGRGTVNVTANLLVEERETIGRIAVKNDISISHFIHDAVLAAISRHDRATAGLLVKIRRHRHQDILDQHNGQLSLGL